MRTRTVARLLAVATTALLPLLVSAGAASASVQPDDGEMPGKPLGTGLTLLYYVVIPLGACLVITALALLPSALRRPRYRPGRAWDFDPLWFRGPDDTDSALAGARPGATARGGASAEW